jgi:hypothetical protein
LAIRVVDETRPASKAATMPRLAALSSTKPSALMIKERRLTAVVR